MCDLVLPHDFSYLEDISDDVTPIPSPVNTEITLAVYRQSACYIPVAVSVSSKNTKDTSLAERRFLD